MKPQLLQPQEIEVFYILPAIRREMALAMKAAGVKQKDIAKLLCVEESTISQYLNNKRAASFRLSGKVVKAAAKSVPRIRDRVSMIAEIQSLLALAKRDGVLCEVHNSVSDVPMGCDVCFRR